MILAQMIEMAIVAGSPPPPRYLGIFVLVTMLPLGLWGAINPRSAAMFGRRWQFEGDVQPSRANVISTRVVGIISVLIAGGVAIGSFFFWQW